MEESKPSQTWAQKMRERYASPATAKRTVLSLLQYPPEDKPIQDALERVLRAVDLDDLDAGEIIVRCKKEYAAFSVGYRPRTECAASESPALRKAVAEQPSPGKYRVLLVRGEGAAMTVVVVEFLVLEQGGVA